MNLRNNTRFYVLVVMFVVSILTALSLKFLVSNSTLYYIRLEQIYGFISLFLLYICLLISPLKVIFSKNYLLEKLVYLRRALGVSVAYFALLHIVVSVWFQFSGLASLGYLPVRFQLSLLLGAIAFIILVFLTITSLDKAVKLLSFRYWKVLHRFVYVAAILIVIHVWMIGTHMLNPTFQSIMALFINVLLGLESYRFAFYVKSRLPLAQNPLFFVTIFFSCWFFWVVMLYQVLPNIAENHHRLKSAPLRTEQSISVEDKRRESMIKL